MDILGPARDVRWWIAVIGITVLGLAVDAATGNWGGPLGTPGDVVMIVGIFAVSIFWERLRSYLHAVSPRQ